MASIFAEVDRNEEAIILTKVKLSELRIQQQYILKEGALQLRDPDESFRDGYFILLYDRIIYCDNATDRTPLGITSIKWKRIDPFTETDI
jgi:hypothetical protein